MAKLNKKIITTGKIVISLLLIYFILSKLDIAEITAVLSTCSILYLAVALCFYILSKVIAAFRLNLYFHQLQIPLDHLSNLKLYLLGMFYNVFLPGGIGGDAYKGYILKKTFNIQTKKIISALVIDRLSGLLWLFIYACALVLFLQVDALKTYQWLLISLIPSAITVFWLLNKKFFQLYYTCILEKFFVICFSSIGTVAIGMGYHTFFKCHHRKVCLFNPLLISSIVSVIPMTIGGIGSREVTFYYGAEILKLDPNISVSIGVLFFIITAIVSLAGIWFHFKKIKLELLTKTKV